MNLGPPRMLDIATGPTADPVVFTRWMLHLGVDLATELLGPKSADVEPRTTTRPPRGKGPVNLFFYLLYLREDERRHAALIRRRERDRKRRGLRAGDPQTKEGT